MKTSNMAKLPESQFTSLAAFDFGGFDLGLTTGKSET